MNNNSQISQLKKAIYIDKVYHGLSLLQSRSYKEPLDLSLSELRIFSQNGEDGILYDLFKLTNPSNPTFIEFGVGDGWSCNTRLLAQIFGWSGYYFECDSSDFDSLARMYMHSSNIKCTKKMLSPCNVIEAFSSLNIPQKPTLLSVDIDGQDFWVTKSILDVYSPDILLLELNSIFPPGQVTCESLSSLENPQPRSLTHAWGVSAAAWQGFLETKGYTLLHYELAGVNVFYLRNDIYDQIQGLLTNRRTMQPSPNFGLSGQYHSAELLYENTQMPLESRALNYDPF